MLAEACPGLLVCSTCRWNPYFLGTPKYCIQVPMLKFSPIHPVGLMAINKTMSGFKKKVPDHLMYPNRISFHFILKNIPKTFL